MDSCKIVGLKYISIVFYVYHFICLNSLHTAAPVVLQCIFFSQKNIAAVFKYFSNTVAFFMTYNPEQMNRFDSSYVKRLLAKTVCVGVVVKLINDTKKRNSLEPHCSCIFHFNSSIYDFGSHNL